MHLWLYKVYAYIHIHLYMRVYVYVCAHAQGDLYGTPHPPKKINLCSPDFCWYLQYFVSIFGGLLDLSFLGTICTYAPVG